MKVMFAVRIPLQTVFGFRLQIKGHIYEIIVHIYECLGHIYEFIGHIYHIYSLNCRAYM